VAQARRLGVALKAHLSQVDAVTSGSMRRHRQTADICAQTLGFSAPIDTDPGWDEYDHQNILHVLAPRYRDRAALAQDLAASEEPLRHFQRLLASKTSTPRRRWKRRSSSTWRRSFWKLDGDFTFVGRQRRLRVGDTWYRVDLLFFHRRLRCPVVIDLELGEFTHADAGQMHLYLNYGRERWTLPGENPPVGLILCAKRDHAVAKYALEGLPNKVLAAEYRSALPEELIAAEVQRTRHAIEERQRLVPKPSASLAGKRSRRAKRSPPLSGKTGLEVLKSRTSSHEPRRSFRNNRAVSLHFSPVDSHHFAPNHAPGAKAESEPGIALYCHRCI
jgi:hypothetical protein